MEGKAKVYTPLNSLLADSFKQHWNRPALSNYGRETITYAELARKIAEIHIFFRACGLERGDKVAICSKNQINWAVSFLATMTYGAVAVPLLHEFQPANIRHLVSHSEAKILFVGDNLWEAMAGMSLPAETIVTLSDFSVVKSVGGQIIGKYPGEFGTEDINYFMDGPEDLAIINYTSGTSGFSKGVMLPFRAIRHNVLFAFEVEPQMNEESKVISMLPTAHMYGMLFEFLFEMALGAHVYFLTRLPSPKVLIDSMADIKPDVVIAVPMILEKLYRQMLMHFINDDKRKMILNMPSIDSVVKERIRQILVDAFGGRFHEVIVGGAAFNKEAEAFLKRINFPMTIGYGMTECAPIITYVPWEKTKLYSCGKAAPGVEIKIDSPNPQKVPGEILVKGDNVFTGYYKNEDATRDAFEDGWFKTGDMGIVDRQGYLFIKGRSKSMILGSSGQNIYPEEIESILNNMPYVVESLVIEDGGKLVGLIYPDLEQAEKDKLSQQQLMSKLQNAMQVANLELPGYCKLSSVEMFPEEFAKTPKKSIKRYLYQRS